MPVLPALQLGGRNVPSSARGRRDATPTNVSGTGRSSGRGGASPIKRERAVMESVGALPLPSSRISDNNNSNNLRLPSQRSARSGGQRSARSRSSDGEGGTGTGASDSESGSNTFDEVPKLAYTTKAGGNFSGSRMQMQSNKYSKQPKSGSAEDLFLSMDQVRAVTIQ